jgi:proteasome lid subunit RPN8/RPN11
MSTDNDLGLFELDFTSGGRETSHLAFLARPAGHPDYVPYDAAAVTSVVYIHRVALEQMRTIALQSAPNETIGVLMGRPCQDDQGTYTLVMAVEQAIPGEYVGTPGSVRISGAGRAAMKARAAQRWPGWEDVGWFHTHPHSPARFSATDYDEQTTLLAHQVGVVASGRSFLNGDDAEPLGVYLGPSGHRLLARQPAALPAPHPVAPNPVDQPDLPKRRFFTPEMLKNLPIGVATIVLLLVALQVGGTVWVHGAVAGDQAQSPNVLAAAPGSDPAPTVVTKRVVERVPALLAARTCQPGERLEVAVRAPRAYRDDLMAASRDPRIAWAVYDTAAREVSVVCVADGETVIEIRHASGTVAGVAISVTSAQPGTAP